MMNDIKDKSKILSVIDEMFSLIIKQKHVFTDEEISNITSDVNELKSNYHQSLLSDLDDIIRLSAKEEFDNSNSLLPEGDIE